MTGAVGRVRALHGSPPLTGPTAGQRCGTLTTRSGALSQTTIERTRTP